MHIIAKKTLKEFWLTHPLVKLPLEVWYRLMSQSTFYNFNELKKAFNAVDYVNPYTIFDVGGNKFRIITVIHYNRQKVYIRYVFTHSEYDRWNKKLRQY